MVSIKDKVLQVLQAASGDPAYHQLHEQIASLTKLVSDWQEPASPDATSPGHQAARDAAQAAAAPAARQDSAPGDAAQAPPPSGDPSQPGAPAPGPPAGDPADRSGGGPGAVPKNFHEAGQMARQRMAGNNHDQSARGANSPPPPQQKRRGRRGATAQGG